MHAFRSPNFLEEISKLREYQIPKLAGLTLSLYRHALAEEEADLQERINWVHGWQRTFDREADKRKTAADEIERRRKKDEFQAKQREERLAKLEEQYHRDTYAE